MAKKNDNPKQQSVQPEAVPAQTPPAPAAAPAPKNRTVTKGQLTAFWSVVAVTVAAAWILDRMLPGTPEYVIERWLMLPFALFLAVFLFRLK